MLTICHISSRRDPKWRWFVDSLDYQTLSEDRSQIELIFIDTRADEYSRANDLKEIIGNRFQFSHCLPKPSVWQGRNRLTQSNWFAASNARNTGIVRAKSDYIVFVDDLSVLTGQWFRAVKEAMTKSLVTLGAYRKIKKLQVENGNIVFSENFPQGIDNRFGLVSSDPSLCAGQWLYGCSFGCPIDYLLQVNGLDEACDGMGFEDCILGIRLANNGIGFQYDRRMMTYESEEDHHIDVPMRRTDKGVSPNDKSHAILALAQSTKRAENTHLGVDGIAGLRRIFQETGEIPLPDGPTHDWYDGQPIAEMT